MAERQPTKDKTDRLKIEEISTATLSQFVYSQEPDLIALSKDIIYHGLFNVLRKNLPQPRQEELLVTFLTQQVEDFPNGEKVAKFIAKLNNIDWFEPQEEPSHEQLQQLSDQFYLQ